MKYYNEEWVVNVGVFVEVLFELVVDDLIEQLSLVDEHQ